MLLVIENRPAGNDDQIFWAPNDMVPRWNAPAASNGKFTNAGYDYMSSIANTGFFQLSARLCSPYWGHWASEAWDCMSTIGLINANSFAVYDGTINRTGVNRTQWSYSASVLLYGPATLPNIY